MSSRPARQSRERCSRRLRSSVPDDTPTRQGARSRRSASSSCCQPVVPITSDAPTCRERAGVGARPRPSRSRWRHRPGQLGPGQARSRVRRCRRSRSILGRQRLDQPAHAAPADQQHSEPHPSSRHRRRREELLVQPRHGGRHVGCHRAPPSRCAGRPPATPCATADVRGRRSRSPPSTDPIAGCRRRALTIAMPRSTCTEANLRESSAIASIRRSSSSVIDTLTSEVVTTSTEVCVPLEHLEDAPEEAVRQQHARRA
jgi:hypothetical protein